MYDNFLNTYAFEQMAREYNAKYNRATLFCYEKKDEEIKLKVKTDFEKFSHLFYMLRKAFKQSAYKFLQVFAEFDKWQKEAAQLLGQEKLECDKNTPRYITHKLCAVELMDVTEHFVKTFADVACGRGAGAQSNTKTQSGSLWETYEGTLHLSEDACFIKRASKLYIKAIELVRQFYQTI